MALPFQSLTPVVPLAHLGRSLGCEQAPPLEQAQYPCTFLNRYVIIDEAQNLTAKQMKTLITRAGPGTKIVCLGNLAQIDTPYLSETTSGLTYAVDRFKEWEYSGHVILLRGERSRLADFAAEAL